MLSPQPGDDTRAAWPPPLAATPSHAAVRCPLDHWGPCDLRLPLSRAPTRGIRWPSLSFASFLAPIQAPSESVNPRPSPLLHHRSRLLYSLFSHFVALSPLSLRKPFGAFGDGSLVHDGGRRELRPWQTDFFIPASVGPEKRQRAVPRSTCAKRALALCFRRIQTTVLAQRHE